MSITIKCVPTCFNNSEIISVKYNYKLYSLQLLRFEELMLHTSIQVIQQYNLNMCSL